MKYSFMSFSCPELSLGDMLDLAKRLGYDGIEPRVSAKHQHGIETDLSADGRAAARAQAAETGVPFCCIATSCRYADPETTQEQVDETLRSIDLAADLGACRVRVFGGTIAKSLDREAAIEHVADALRSAADHAAERGVVVCMETHDDWCNPEHVAAVMRRVDHAGIAVNWDIMHPIRRGDATMDEAYQALKPWVKHVHFHDGATVEGKTTLVPIGEGDIDHRRAVELLSADAYPDFLSGEWIGWEPFDIHLPRELATIREYETQAG